MDQPIPINIMRLFEPIAVSIINKFYLKLGCHCPRDNYISVPLGIKVDPIKDTIIEIYAANDDKDSDRLITTEPINL